MNEKENRYFFSLIKGRIAENICEEMFNKMGYQIERFGIENKLPSITKILKRYENTGSIRKLRNMPDFVIEIPEVGVRFLEVKFRFDARIQPKHVDCYQEYPETIFLVFTPSQIYVLDSEVIDKSCNKKSLMLLTDLFVDSTIFNFSDEQRNTIEQFTRISTRFFAQFTKETNSDQSND